MNENLQNSRLLIISNRLPFIIEKNNQSLTLKPGSGGLATALAPVLKDRGGVWIGWPGTSDLEEQEVINLIDQSQRSQGFLFSPVFLTKEEVSLYYEGFSNEIIWPLFHDFQMQCRFVPEYWQAYQNVNGKFAAKIAEHLQPNDFVWVHDYQLMLVGQELRRIQSFNHKIAFFLHIPFPPLDIFLKLPWRFQIIHALLQYDLIGFQTMRDKRNFIQCVRTLIKEARVAHQRTFHVCQIGEREVRIGTFPISIDYSDFERLAASKKVSDEVENLKKSADQQTLIFSLDRLDYTKGIPFRLEAIRRFLDKYPQFHKKVQFIQLVVPSRVEIPKYRELWEEINRLVGEINSQWTYEGWVPIHHLFRSFDRTELSTHYRASEIILITPIKDGMNLVAKEYIASNVDENGTVILSEFAGAAAQIYKEALLINPFDTIGVADAIYNALTMSQTEKRKRMRRMRRELKKNDIFHWVENFLNAAISKVLKDFPLINEYIPPDDSLEKKN